MRKNIFAYIIALLALTLPCGCIEEESFDNTPTGNFDALWNLIDQRYCFLEYAHEQFGLNWNSVYHKYKAKIEEETSERQLFSICGEMLGELRDGHVNLSSVYGTAFYWDWKLHYPANFSDSIQRKYLGNKFMLNNGIKYVQLPDSIGYAYIGSFDKNFGSGNITAMMLDVSSCKALILDIRNNGGGLITSAESLASHFTDEKIKIGYIQHKTGSAHDAFSSPEAMYLSPGQGAIWKRPVIILTNRGVFSAANHFVIMMKELSHVTIVGDSTGGGSGLPFNSTLPNGWSVRFSASPILDAEGNHTEFGIEPDVKVDISSEDWNKGVDTIIEEAIKIAKELTKKKE
ncbi:MAG: S41 family peptidase [Bacteroidaceae bacterium]|nr:S41 family peptidase [Bacteroidaceae bacterium]